MASSYWLTPDVFRVGFLGVLGSILGLLLLLSRPERAGRGLSPAGWVPVFLLGAVAGVLAALRQPASLIVPPTLLAGVCCLFQIMRSPRLQRVGVAALGFCRRPAVQGTVLLMACPAFALFWTERIESDISFWVPDPALIFACETVDVSVIDPSPVVTDGGRSVPVFRPSKPAPPAELSRQAEIYVLERGEFRDRVIRTETPNQDYNCHGWVFTGGRYWVVEEHLETILQDNGYRVVSAPRPGDLVIYRDAEKRIVHSGVVRLADGDAQILVESKWGKIGRFIHPPQVGVYGDSYAYYRSDRPGHCLLGVARETIPPPGGRSQRGELVE